MTGSKLNISQVFLNSTSAEIIGFRQRMLRFYRKKSKMEKVIKWVKDLRCRAEANCTVYGGHNFN
jgi:hypothetical protein